MPKPLVRMVKLNGLQWNANHDPQAWRREAGVPFRLQVLLEGAGEAEVRLADAAGRRLAGARVARPGTFTHEIVFDTPGSRLVTIEVDADSERYAQTLRLDTLAAD